MVIPWVQIRWISDQKGYGLFATRFIPKGTISFVQDGLDIVISKDELDLVHPKLKVYVEKYSYEDFLGNRIVSWDLGKYMNHDDEANTLSTGYGFEIAVKDIHEGDEVTDDYRIFSTHHNTTDWHLAKEGENLVLQLPEELERVWNDQVFSAILDVDKVEQPLRSFLDDEIWSAIVEVQKCKESYKPVGDAFPLQYKLRCEGQLSEKQG